MTEWQERAEELKAKRIERRTFLKGAIGLSGLAMLEGSKIAKALVPRSPLPPPGSSGLNTIVVSMMENRSLDHYLGWMPGIDGIQNGVNPKSLDAAGACDPMRSSPFAIDDATMVNAHHLTSICDFPDPDHGWDGSRVEFNYGAMDGFVERSGELAMGYYNAEDIPFLAWMAQNYTTFSNYHCSVMGPTYPNREYMHSAQAGGVKTNAIPAPSPSNPSFDGYTWPTIWEKLNAAGVEWAYYGTDLPVIALWFHLVRENPGRVRHIVDYFIDAAAGTLPPVVFIDPSFEVIGNDDHPSHDIRLGQRFMYDTFLALAEGPQWANSAYILTYDEHGGFYDHVPPPRTADIRASSNPCEDWGRLGFRVPTVIASPFTKTATIGTNLYDHASILKLIEWRFGLSPLTARDDVANNIGEVFDFANPQTGLPGQMPDIPIWAQGVLCATEQGAENTPRDLLPPIPAPPLANVSGPPHADLTALANSGFFGPFDFRERAKQGVWRS